MFEDVSETTRRVPRQRRSRRTRDRVLDAAETLLAESGSAAVTTTRIAERAGIAVGSVYAYFADRDAVAEAIALRHWQRFADLVVAAAEVEERGAAGDSASAAGAAASDAAAGDLPPGAERRDAAVGPLATVIDALAAGFRGQPAFLALWYGDLRTARMRDLTRPIREQVAVSVQRVLRVHWPDPSAERLEVAARAIVVAGDGLLREAFRVDPQGDPALLRESRTMLEAYAAAALG